ncbi:ABC-three component system protein [Glutamicibacter arilaitensis]|uniref:ABC-three component system protein n=1 Tax=Glutamicibacter arilaitensis TaxID=256701 RepID=UPI003FCF6C8E
MLLTLTSDLPNFKTASFQPGLNIAVAERTKNASTEDSRNAVGKSSFVGTLDFLLGASAGTNHVARRPEIVDYSFELKMHLGSSTSIIHRSGQAPNEILVDGSKTNLEGLKNILGSELFGLTGSESEPSFRQLIAYYLRNESAGGFQEAIRTNSRQANLATQLPLAYLFGLDTAVPRRAMEISTSKKSLQSLRSAAKDPIFGRAVGSVEELEAEISTLTISRIELERQLDDYQVIEMYTEHVERADELSRRIRQLNDESALALQRTKDLQHSLEGEDTLQPDHGYLADVYEQVGIVFPERALRSYTEVEAFHESVVRNRRLYLSQELSEAEERVVASVRSISELDAQRSEIMVLLQAGGALETFQMMQKELGAIEGRIAELREKLANVVALKEARSHLQKQSMALEDSTKLSLHSLEEQVQFIGSLFSEFAFEIYGKRRPATLGIRESDQGYVFTPTLGGDSSAGVKSIEIFCFDLAMAVTAHRFGNGPDFLVHDSHLYDAVEARQVASALRVASNVCRDQGIQYVVALNSDALEKASATVSDLEFHQCATLTDEYDTGGFFGKRFN